MSFDYFLEKNNGNYTQALKLYKERQTNSLEKCIKKYGEEKGKIIYQQTIKSRLCGFEGKSKIEFEFLTKLYNEIKKDFNTIYFGDNKQFFFTTEEIRTKYNKKTFIPDFYIKDIKLCVEVFGDFWHMNPATYNENDVNSILEKNAKEVWESDAERLDFLRSHYGANTIIVWEKEIRLNRNKMLKKVKDKIYEFSKITN